MAFGAKLTAASDYLFRRLFKFLFRYDIFISYALRLMARFKVRFSELPAGNSS